MNEDPSAKQWLFAMIETFSQEDFARVAITLWDIWYARRKIIHDDEFQSPVSILGIFPLLSQSRQVEARVRVRCTLSGSLQIMGV
jgi:hypothetical protein